MALLNQAIRILRVSKGLRQVDLARLVRIPQPRLSDIERGVLAPSDFEQNRLLRALGVPAKARQGLRGETIVEIITKQLGGDVPRTIVCEAEKSNAQRRWSAMRRRERT
jgi:transcriptional regulator with XRE-family HTH domain